MNNFLKAGATALCLAASPVIAEEGKTLLDILTDSPIADLLDTVSAQIVSACNRFNTIQSIDGNNIILLSSCQNAEGTKEPSYYIQITEDLRKNIFKQLESIGVYDRCFAITKPDNAPVEAFTVFRCKEPPELLG